MKKEFVRFMKYDCEVIKSEYVHGGTALQLMEIGTQEPIATATVWIPDLQKGEVAIKDYSENEGMLMSLTKALIVSEPIRHVASGFVTIPVCKLLI